MWQLGTGIPLPLGDVIEDTTGSHDGDKGNSSKRLKAATPCGQPRARWWRWFLQSWQINKQNLSLDMRPQDTHWGGGRCGKQSTKGLDASHIQPTLS